MFKDSHPAIKRLREICLKLPQAFEKEAWGECTFRVNDGSMFAMTDCNHHDSGHTAVWVKAPPMVQETLVHSAPKRFFRPPYMGAKGWVGVRLDLRETDWEELAEIVRDGYLMSVPKKMLAKKTVAPKASRMTAGKRPAPPPQIAVKPKTSRTRAR